MSLIRKNAGFNLLELITVMLVVSILATVVGSRMMPNTTLQLQAARDLLVTSLLVAQQKSMAQKNDVRLSTSATSFDIRIDSNDNAVFSSDESIRSFGTTFPIEIPGGVTSTVLDVDYNQLGQTSASTITLTKGSASVVVTISGTGYAY